jgi:hypothetical protein
VIVEKYDVQRRESDVASGITFGYAANQVGFGWTNAAYLDLLAGLEHRRQPRVATGVRSGLAIRWRAFAFLQRRRDGRAAWTQGPEVTARNATGGPVRVPPGSPRRPGCTDVAP